MNAAEVDDTPTGEPAGDAAPSEEARQKATVEYNTIVETAAPVMVRLKASKFEAKADYIVQRLQEQSGKITLAKSIVGHHEFYGYNANEGTLLGFFSWTVQIKRRKILLSARADYIVGYAHVPNVSEAVARKFLGHVGKFAAYPYFRVYISQMAAMAGADMPPLPLLK